jgi:hypothetical protein
MSKLQAKIKRTISMLNVIQQRLKNTHENVLRFNPAEDDLITLRQVANTLRVPADEHKGYIAELFEIVPEEKFDEQMKKILEITKNSIAFLTVDYLFQKIKKKISI